MSTLLDVDIPSAVGRPSRQFMTTYWPLVRSAALPGPERDEALTLLVRQYSPALKQYLQARFRVDASTAEDLVQGFLVNKVLKRNLLENASQGRQKFRSFLCKAIFRWRLDMLRKDKAAKRIPPGCLSPLEATDEGDVSFKADDAEQFDNAFVRQVLANAIHRLHKHCACHEQQATWTIFYHRILAPTLEIAEPRPYEDLVRELGLTSSMEARNRLLTAKRIFKRELEAVVAEYSEDWAEAEEELKELRRLLR